MPFFSTLYFLNDKILSFSVYCFESATPPYTLLKESKTPNHWSSAVPKKYKINAILRDLHRAHKISSNLELEKQRIKKKYLSVNFSYNFIQPTFNSYQQKCESLIPNWLFEEQKKRKKRKENTENNITI